MSGTLILVSCAGLALVAMIVLAVRESRAAAPGADRES